MAMRQLTAGFGLGLLLLTGCNPNAGGWRPYGGNDRPPAEAPTVPALVDYLNWNARKVQAIQANRVAIDCKQGGQGAGLDGMLACQKPHNFRLQARLFGNPAVDIGSNEEEFWYWISKAEPPYVYHCTYPDLARGVRMPFPFQPEMIVAALGMAEYDPQKPYELKVNKDTLELIETATSPQGQPVKKVTVFNRAQAGPGRPQVTGHILKDAQGVELCTATISEVQQDRGTGAILPYRVKLVWPAQKIEMTLRLGELQVVNIEPERAQMLFSRRDLRGHQGFDLARGVPDGGAPISQVQSLQRVGPPPPPPAPQPVPGAWR
jgi:hypothetical protein